MWARAMYTYDKVAKNIGPKKEALAQAEGELEVVQSELGKKQDALRKVGGREGQREAGRDREREMRSGESERAGGRGEGAKGQERTSQ